MKKFTFFWLGGKRDVLPGETPEEAMNKAGYGQGALKALDFHAEGDNQQYEWSGNSWTTRKDLKKTLGELTKGQCFHFPHENMVRYVSQQGRIETYCPGVTQDTMGHSKEGAEEVYINSSNVILIPNQTAGVVRESAPQNQPIKLRTMQKPYLIQRAKFENREGKTGIDSLLRFDYMGSSEFEWGALPKALKRMRDNIANYVQFQYSFKEYPSKVVTVFCTKEQQEFAGDMLERIARKEFWLKEYCDLDNYLSPKNEYRNNDFWWDIEQDWMFWKFTPDFDLKFKNALINP